MRRVDREGRSAPLITRDRTGTLSAVATRLHVIAGLTTEVRRSALVDAHTLVHLNGDVDRVSRWLRRGHPQATKGGQEMGTIYRRKVKFCPTCDRRLDTTAAWHGCQSAGHPIEIREQSVWWIKYQVNGRPQCVSSGSEKKAVAKSLLKRREGDVEQGLPVTAVVNRITFDQAAEDLLTDYTTNQRRSLRVLKLRLKKHLTP